MSDTGDSISLNELVEYCQTQARLLHGHADTLEAETSALLSEIDEELSTVRSQLNERDADGIDHTPSPDGPDGTNDDNELADLETLENELTEKQAVVKAKQTRREAFERLATDYLELTEQLNAETPPPSQSLKRVMQFEHDHDAPTYFDERTTLLEAAVDSE